MLQKYHLFKFFMQALNISSWQSGLLGFWHLSIARYSKNISEIRPVSIPGWGGGRHVFCWVHWKEVTSITGQPVSCKLLLAFASTVVFGSRSHRTHGHMCLWDCWSCATRLTREWLSCPANCCWPSPAQFMVSGPHDQIWSFQDLICLEISPFRREDWLVFLSRLHICCTVISHECTGIRVVFVLYGHHTRFVTLL
jgi:hypothetical protein